jgi:hypothetical protein
MANKVGAANITFHECKVGRRANCIKILNGRAVFEQIVNDHIDVWALFDNANCEMRTNKASSSSHQNSLWIVLIQVGRIHR